MVFVIFNNTVSFILGILLPIFTFIFLFIYWYRNGKDLSVETIPVAYKANENFSELTNTDKTYGIGFLLFFIGMLTSTKKKNILSVK
jgi:Ca2+/Na+ antiporter